jgi:hypothetical protein
VRYPYSLPAAPPTGIAAAAHAGTVPAGEYFYAVSSTTSYGESLVCTPIEWELSAAGGAALVWDAATYATGYRVYRGPDASSLAFLAATTATSYTDDGSAVPGAAPPATDTSGSMRARLALNLIRSVTPAHLALEVGYTAGFIVGVSDIGIDAL